MESLEVKKYYKWTSGNRNGEVECYIAETETDVYFESGISTSKESFNTIMSEIPEGVYLEVFNKKKTIADKQKEWESMLGNPVIEPNSVQPVISSTPDLINNINCPIEIILDKQKSKDKRNLSIQIELNIPAEKVIEFLTMMFDEDEVYEKIVDRAFKEFGISELKKLVQSKLKE